MRAPWRLALLAVALVLAGELGSLVAGEAAPEEAQLTPEEQLAKKLQERRTLLQSMAKALTSVASKGDSEAFATIRGMVNKCEEALKKADETPEPAQQLAIIERALSERQQWIQALTAVQAKKADEQREDDFKRTVTKEL
eukprot:TRINITY_DN39787_c0_g1_i1.p1 TRINITY_DN39787_c0_g1~~TRINITY_DN39787_c0_g1_i1.p1  ORF type:complete len:160 (-),score=56.72 TRINITY_DN39787_c0_g1_i1:137-556(-)